MIATFHEMYERICGEISDRKQAEATLRRHNHDMQQYIEQVDKVTASATAVHEGTFNSATLDDVAQRNDQLGQLARMFQLMAAHVQQRERQLKQQLMELTIEIDQVKLQKQVAQITESDYFREIQAELKDLQPDKFWRS